MATGDYVSRHTGEEIDDAVDLVASKSTVSVSATGTATDTIKYITVDNVQKKINNADIDISLYQTITDNTLTTTSKTVSGAINELVSGKQDTLSSAQISAVDSGITVTLVTGYDSHLENTSNPHSVTATQVGLGNCDNTSDLNKPISTATQTALDLKVDKTTTIGSHNLSGNITAQNIADDIKDITVTVTNKTIDADDNTISNITSSNIKSGKTATEGSSNNDVFAMQGYVDSEIAKVVATTYTFKGYISTSTPTGTLNVGDLWYNSSTLPTTFPVQCKSYTGSAWTTTTTRYTPKNLDTWSLVSDGHGYYWFGGGWNIMDTNTSTTDNVTINRNSNNQLQVKDGGISNAKMATDVKIGSLSSLSESADSVVAAINNKASRVATSVTNLSAITKEGTYYLTGTINGYPTSGTAVFLIEVIKVNTSYLYRATCMSNPGVMMQSTNKSTWYYTYQQWM